MTLLKLSKVQTFTPQKRVLCQPVSFDLGAGQIHAIQGENGVGKTTLVRTILGLHSHYSGHIERTFQRVSYLPQVGHVQFFLPLTLAEVAQLSDNEESGEMPLLFSDPSRMDRDWNSASGGERQKALLLRAFRTNADLIILDEPLNHLDAKSKDEVLHYVEKVRSLGKAILWISHEPNQGFKNFTQSQLQAEVAE